uniref:Mastoparan-J n=1 Tax=Polistes jokahamae TaxID=256662 RepID=MAST_POLJO|nr:RecName: Full=Mastoparan-J; AltName: Full=Polistes mastoparan; Short=P-MP [Polistes jokahamae]prf//0607189A mastoparan [Polistes jokahamae]
VDWKKIGQHILSVL